MANENAVNLIETNSRLMNPQLYDTFSRKVLPLSAEDGKQFRFYCCGPTVYGPAHIGNFRTFTLQDVFRRMLEVAGLQPVHVRNITDVDDKTIRGAQAEGTTLEAFTRKWADKFHADCAALNLLEPTVEPSAVAHIPEQIEMIEKLIVGGHAYATADGSVYFRVSSFPDYGRLARLDPDSLRTQATNSGEARNQADEYERDTVADFALWKAAKPEDGDNHWDSPWGRGRPGWHIECSAMSIKHLGNTFDLHGGGIDLIFPHHENEIAQSRCYTGQDVFARHWFHCAHLMVEGQKMSKSLGNLYTLDELRARGVTPEALRYTLMNGHYRQPLNFTFNSLHASQSALEKLEKEVSKLLEATGQTPDDWKHLAVTPAIGFFAESDAPFKPAWDKLTDDLNVPGCLGALFSEFPLDARHGTDLPRALQGLATLLYALGLSLFVSEERTVEVPQAIADLAQARWDAKQAKNWAMADQLRAELTAAGWQVKDHKDGYDLMPLG